jgi:hypothetical protein
MHEDQDQVVENRDEPAGGPRIDTDPIGQFLIGGLFAARPNFRVRVAVFLERQECRFEPPKEGEYAFGEEERRAIARAFLRAFPEGGGGAVPVEGDEGEILAGEALVEALDVPAAWNEALGNLLEELSEEELVRDAKGALSALDLLRMEVQEEVWEDLVAQAFSAGKPRPDLRASDGDAG